MKQQIMAGLIGLAASVTFGATAVANPDYRGVSENYANIAHAMYGDALITANKLKTAVDALVADPSPATLAYARGSWLAARVPYQQTEGYRFGNAMVDDWEGRVNAWPLDEGLIDYVDSDSYGAESDTNRLYTANVIANKSLRFGGETVDATEITPALLQDSLHEADNIEANVATGYHAIEFLLWGQDLNGTEAGAGNRPYTDFDTANCTGGNCDRRIAYLQAATDLLIADLEEMVEAWDQNGAARLAVTEADGPDALATIITGLGSLSYGELAGERMQLGLLLNDPEEEHDCFADNTHNSHYYDQAGMQAIYTGRYTRVDGRQVSGPSVASVVAEANPELNRDVLTALSNTHDKMDVMKAAADGGMAYDQMLASDNPVGNAIVQDVIDALTAQAKQFEAVVAALGLNVSEFEGSDSLDDPNAVFQ
ncbi:MAG: peptidase [Alphaproteobacteria bacterium]|nr:peptidase [Alphaproteobacteria bacterium]MAS48797.1 peptidase [Alphaproteobacteria bacterium]MAX94338.1 peptidase [Alphaproteobacteria bacterium]MBN52815.1 peptidase [Alphaproteobacteria bacterium]OUT39419.1 MAG: peptidase [Micavibrio sp. TMED2]|tara:strand:- start:40276 stop:41553 length:1278 start_codon:yes stop_codon:yes gene_type:complete